MAEYLLVAGNILPMVQFPVAVRPDGLHIGILSQSLGISQSVQVRSPRVSALSTFQLSQAVVANKRLQVSADNFLSFTHRGTRIKEGLASNLLVFSQSGKKVLPQAVNQALSFSQAVLCVRGLNSTLNLLDVATCNIVKVILIEDVLVLDQGIVGQNAGNWQFVEPFIPLIEDYDPYLLQIPPTPPTPINVLFQDSLTELSFGNVDYGDSERVEHTRINRRSRGENLIIYRDSVWPKTDILKFKLIDLSYLQGQGLLNFIRVNLAKQVVLRDWLGVRWRGVIINPEADLIQTNRDDRFEIEIEFQGIQIRFRTPSNVHTLNLSHSVSYILVP